MILAVANMKGGCGKTITAIYLARYLSALVVDADPQGSAADWSDAVADDGKTFDVPVVRLPDPKLADRLPKADRLVIDCSPRDHRITDAAIGAADLVVIPTASTSADMDRTWPTFVAPLEVASRAAAATPSHGISGRHQLPARADLRGHIQGAADR